MGLAGWPCMVLLGIAMRTHGVDAAIASEISDAVDQALSFSRADADADVMAHVGRVGDLHVVTVQRLARSGGATVARCQKLGVVRAELLPAVRACAQEIAATWRQSAPVQAMPMSGPPAATLWLAGAGAADLALGVLSGLRARDAYRALQNATTVHRSETVARGQRDQRLANVCFATSAAALALSAVVWWRDAGVLGVGQGDADGSDVRLGWSF